MRRLQKILMSLFLITWFAANGFAQVATSVITGKVLDRDSLPVSGAKVIARNVATGTLFADLTAADGAFRIPGVDIGGPYTLQVSQPGFFSWSQGGIYLKLGTPEHLVVLLKQRESSRKRSRKHDNHCVVVLSMDGFRWDYPKIYPTPNLDRLAREGCRAESLKPSYPTKTFPNHYAIATGLYPDHNGIVQNSFYDPQLDRVFRMGDRQAVQDSIFWEGEAIWETAERQGLKTASYFWVGTEADERYRPGKRKIYEDGFPYRQQIDTVFKWLALPAGERPGLILFYFDEPDKTSHDFGPVSAETKGMVKKLDGLVGELMAGIDKIEKKNGPDIDLVIVSDHGMGYIPKEHQIILEDIVGLNKIKRINGGNPVLTLEPEPGFTDEIYNRLKSTPHLKVWKRSELPLHYHYGTHIRIPELVVEADSAYGIEIRRKGKYSLGMHGYDPDNRDMHGIFYASGPSFKTGYVQPTFENVDIYELLARLLKIRPAKTDGHLGKVEGMLRGN